MGSRRRIVRFVVPDVLCATVVRCVAAGGEASPSSILIERRKCRVIGDAGAAENCIWVFGAIPWSGVNTTRHALHGASRRRQANASGWGRSARRPGGPLNNREFPVITAWPEASAKPMAIRAGASRRSRERRGSQFVFSGDPQDLAGALLTVQTFLKAA